MKVERIIFTGGGSGGHVMPAINLIKKLKKSYSIEIGYIGSKNGIEKKLIKELNIRYFSISSGKLRRYLSFENVFDLFKVLWGTMESFFYLLNFNTKTIIFSTGGFVSVPVVLAAFLTGKKIFVHEQTSRIGLANKIASKFATNIFTSFTVSAKFLPASKVIHSGYPIREEIFFNREYDKSSKPILFITGGGNGSKLLNDFIKRNLDTLIEKFEIHHQVGQSMLAEFEKIKKSNVDQYSSYIVYDFIKDEIVDLFNRSEIIISRSGAGTVCELIALGKKSIFVPLKIAQKNEQFHNAQEAKNKIGSIIVSEDELKQTDQILLEQIFSFEPNLIKKMPLSNNGTNKILNHILGNN